MCESYSLLFECTNTHGSRQCLAQHRSAKKAMFQTTGLLLSTTQALLFQTIFRGKQIHVLGDMDRQEEQAEKKRTPPSLDINNVH